jgi:hypothetical protein
MSVHNGAEFLRPAVESILGQTVGDFELLVFDDGSTDESGAILRSYRDERLRIVRNETCIGLTRSLIHGLELARGELVARMDADDIALPHRLGAQQAFLDRHPDVGIVGGQVTFIDRCGRPVPRVYPYPRDDLHIRWMSAFQNPFAHPAVMVRRPLLVRHGLTYDAHFRSSQDYDLWARLLRVAHGANLRVPLVRYRLHEKSVGRVRAAESTTNRCAIGMRTLRAWLPGLEFSPRQYLVWQRVYDESAFTIPLPGPLKDVAGPVDGTPGGGGGAGLDPGPDAVTSYLDLLQRFLAAHGQRRWPRWANQTEWSKAVRAVLRPPLRKETGAVALRLLRAGPEALCYAIPRTLKVVVNRWLRRRARPIAE